jgi:hypothetical protein
LSRCDPRRFDWLDSLERLDDPDLRDDELGFDADCLEDELGRDAGCLEDELGRDAGCLDGELGRAAGSLDDELGRVAGCLDGELGRTTDSLDDEPERVAGCLDGELGRDTGCLVDEPELALGVSRVSRSRAFDGRDGASADLPLRESATLLEVGRSRNSIGSRSELRGDERSVLRGVVLRATCPAPFLLVNVDAVVSAPERLFG